MINESGKLEGDGNELTVRFKRSLAAGLKMDGIRQANKTTNNIKKTINYMKKNLKIQHC